jgi:hypothetical protein
MPELIGKGQGEQNSSVKVAKQVAPSEKVQTEQPIGSQLYRQRQG